MTALDCCWAEAARIITAKKEAIRTGKNEVPYTDHEGISHTLYYTSGRWVDAWTMANTRRQFPGVKAYREQRK